jgi:hypothetical protein
MEADKRMDLEVSEELAAEGYRFYAQEAIAFAEASAKAVAEALAWVCVESETGPISEVGPV